MEIVGIISLVFGIIGLISSIWYIGIIPCAVGIVLGIVALTDYLADKKFAVAGLLISILGAVVSVYMFASDVDSGRLIVLYNNGKKEIDVASETEATSKNVQNFDSNTLNNNEEYQNTKENQKQEEHTNIVSNVVETTNNETTREEVQTNQNNGNQEDKLLYQDENVIITYTGMSEDDYGWYDFNLIVENKSDKTLTVQAREMSINGFMVSLPMCSIEVSGGKKAMGSIKITLDDAENIPFKSVSTAETKFCITDMDDIINSYYETQNIVIQ